MTKPLTSLILLGAVPLLPHEINDVIARIRSTPYVTDAIEVKRLRERVSTELDFNIISEARKAIAALTMGKMMTN